MIDKFYTTQDVQQMLCCSYKTILRYIKSGKLKCYEIARKKLISEEQLKEFLEKSRG